jgi:hypothetical protein
MCTSPELNGDLPLANPPWQASRCVCTPCATGAFIRGHSLYTRKTGSHRLYTSPQSIEGLPNILRASSPACVVARRELQVPLSLCLDCAQQRFNFAHSPTLKQRSLDSHPVFPLKLSATGCRAKNELSAQQLLRIPSQQNEKHSLGLNALGPTSGKTSFPNLPLICRNLVVGFRKGPIPGNWTEYPPISQVAFFPFHIKNRGEA